MDKHTHTFSAASRTLKPAVALSQHTQYTFTCKLMLTKPLSNLVHPKNVSLPVFSPLVYLEHFLLFRVKLCSGALRRFFLSVSINNCVMFSKTMWIWDFYMTHLVVWMFTGAMGLLFCLISVKVISKGSWRQNGVSKWCVTVMIVTCKNGALWSTILVQRSYNAVMAVFVCVCMSVFIYSTCGHEGIPPCSIHLVTA